MKHIHQQSVDLESASASKQNELGFSSGNDWKKWLQASFDAEYDSLFFWACQEYQEQWTPKDIELKILALVDHLMQFHLKDLEGLNKLLELSYLKMALEEMIQDEFPYF